MLFINVPTSQPEPHHNYYQNHTITIAKIPSSLPLQPPPLLYSQNYTNTITRTTFITITRTTQSLLPEPHHHYCQSHTITIISSGVTSTISEGGIFIYSCFAQLIFFEVDSILNEINCAEHEYVPLTYRADDATDYQNHITTIIRTIPLLPEPHHHNYQNHNTITIT